MRTLPSLAYFFAAAPFAALAVHFSSTWIRLMRAMPHFPFELPPESSGTRALGAAILWVIGLAYLGAGCIGVAALI
jgi:hypothetical protein